MDDVTTAPGHPPAVDASSSRSFFERTIVGWDIAFWIMLGLGLVMALVSGLGRTELWVVLGLLVALAAAYATFGRVALRTRAGASRHVYRIVLVITLGVLIGIDPNFSLMLYIAFPQLWVFSERIRDGVAYSAAMIVTIASMQLVLSDFSSTAL